MSEQINKVLYNCDQTADTTAAQKAQARANIDAVSSTELANGLATKQDALTAGPNIDIINNIVSTEKPRVEAGTNVSVTGVLDNVNRIVTYTVSATDTTYSAGSGLSLNGTTFSVDTPVPPPASGSAGKVLTVEPDNTIDWEPVQAGDTYDFRSGDCTTATTSTGSSTTQVTYDVNVGTGLEQDGDNNLNVKLAANGGLAADNSGALYSTRAQVNLGSSGSQGPVLTPQDSLSVWPANLRMATSTGSTMNFEAWMAPDPAGNQGKFLGVDSNGDIAWTPKVMRFDTPKTPQLQYNSATEVPWTIMGGAATLYLEFAARPDPADVDSWSAMTLQLATANSKPYYIKSKLMQDGDYSVYTAYGANATGAKADLGQLMDGVQPAFTSRNETESIELDIYVGDGVYQDDDHWRHAKVTITRVGMPSTSSTTPPRLLCTCEYEGK